MLESSKQYKIKVLHSSFNPAVNKQDVTSQKFPYTLPLMGNTCTDKLCTATTVHFLWAKWFVYACHYKVFICSNYTRAQVKRADYKGFYSTIFTLKMFDLTKVTSRVAEFHATHSSDHIFAFYKILKLQTPYFAVERKVSMQCINSNRYKLSHDQCIYVEHLEDFRCLN